MKYKNCGQKRQDFIQIKQFLLKSTQIMQRSKFREPKQHEDLQVFDDIENLPINNSERICTDILCTIIGLGFTLVLAILAIVLFDRPTYEKQVFPADTDGMTCGHDLPGYNYLYFGNPSQLGNRVCVRYCPTSDAQGLKCSKNSVIGCSFGQGAEYYENEPVTNEYGMFCMPKDESQRQSLEDQMHSYSKDLYYNSVHTIGTSLIVATVASFLYMLFVQCLPKAMNRVAVVLGIVAIIALAVCFIVYPSRIGSETRLVVFFLTVLFLLIILCTFAKNFRSWGLNGIFLEYSTKFVCARLYVLVLPFVFLFLMAAFLFCQLLQYRSFWSNGELKFEPETELYHKVESPTSNIILSVLQVIQIYWGIVFLKEAFNYIISAEAVEWYYGHPCQCCNGLFTMVCKHLGSVIACSFMTAFFGIWDFIFDALIPDCDPNTSNPIFQCCNCFAGYFDLTRSDSMAFVYLTGNAYCNSARYCEYVVGKSELTGSSQSSSRIYIITAHFAIAGIVCILALFVFNHGEVSISAMGILLLLSLGVSTFFVSLHADAAEAILILLLTEEEFARRNTSKATHRHGNYVSDKQEDLAKDVNDYQKGNPKDRQREDDV